MWRCGTRYLWIKNSIFFRSVACGMWRTMHCAFIGYCLLTVVKLSVSMDISQNPRFIGVKTHRSVQMYCLMDGKSTPVTAKWFKASKHNSEPESFEDKSGRFWFYKKGNIENGLMGISKVQPADSGVYYCTLNNSTGPGTELQVFRKFSAKQAVMRSTIKDAMIFIQALLLAAVGIASWVLHRKQAKKEEEIVYEEPEDNHIYEGLGIEHCGLYEDIPAVCQNSEATWEKSPCEE